MSFLSLFHFPALVLIGEHAIISIYAKYINNAYMAPSESQVWQAREKIPGVFFFWAYSDSVSPWRGHQAAEPRGSREGEEVTAELPKEPEGGETGQ